MGTELDFMLRRFGVKHVIIVGTQYPNCIRTTAYDAVSLEYKVTNVTDATSGKSPEVEKANITDMKNIGINCVTYEEFKKTILQAA
jgi:nicotinamidase-related amidase